MLTRDDIYNYKDSLLKNGQDVWVAIGNPNDSSFKEWIQIGNTNHTYGKIHSSYPPWGDTVNYSESYRDWVVYKRSESNFAYGKVDIKITDTSSIKKIGWNKFRYYVLKYAETFQPGTVGVRGVDGDSDTLYIGPKSVFYDIIPRWSDGSKWEDFKNTPDPYI